MTTREALNIAISALRGVRVHPGLAAQARARLLDVLDHGARPEFAGEAPRPGSRDRLPEQLDRALRR